MKFSSPAIALSVFGPSSRLFANAKSLRGSSPQDRSLLGLYHDDDKLNPLYDPYLWLEDIHGNESLAWVEEQNKITLSSVESHPVFNELYNALSEISNSQDRIPYVSVRHGLLYNFWRDDTHVRGILRRTTLEDYKTEHPTWETVLDIDALSETENEPWVYQGATCLQPEEVRCMIDLSRGGQDASVLREFDMETMSFVEDGFVLPEALSSVAWQDDNTLWVGTDFGEGSTTVSGYPRIAKLWQRNTPLESATTIFEGNVTDLGVFGRTDIAPEASYSFVIRYPTFNTQIHYLYLGDNEEVVKLDLPEDAALNRIFKGYVQVTLQSDWDVEGTVYKSGSLLAMPLESFLEGNRSFKVLFEPSERVALDRVSSSSDGINDYIIYTTLDNVRSRMYRLSVDEEGAWTQDEIELPGLGTALLDRNTGIGANFFITYQDFLTPTTLYEVNDDLKLESVKSSPELFNADGVTVDQHEATSKDGTQIPYFIVKPANYTADGNNPTKLYGYGGFQVSLQPHYSSTTGSAWIERGGVYVVANIRGGGEFGPSWHQAAVRENHQNNFDDFIAVAEDLIERNVTSPPKLGIHGGSQGGLLVGGSFVQRPDLFGAVACQVPLLDMRRFNQLLRGASWVDEYGDPDTEDWENFIRDWSPYHNLEEDKEYPEVLFTTSTNDDRVHPAHARKMAAKMQDMGHPVYFYEATEGGHGGGASLNQVAYEGALIHTYLWKQLGMTPSDEMVDEEDGFLSEDTVEIARNENPDLP